MKGKKTVFLLLMLCCLLLCLAGCQEPEHIHTPAADDGDCTTKVLCTVCDDTLVPAKKAHVDENLDGVCDNCPTKPDYLYNEETKTYTVYTAKGLYAWAQKWGNLILAKDIVMPEEMTVDLDGDGVNESNWKPLTGFTLAVDGKGHKISNLVIRSTSSNVGFIGHLTAGGSVRNLQLADVSIEGYVTVGGITGAASGVTIENCSVSGTISARQSNVGGIVGSGSSITMTACRNDAEVSGSGMCGGIVGQYNGGVITACINTGDIRPFGDIYGATGGGVVGTGFSGTIRACYSIGKVETGKGTNPMSGGIVGSGNGTVLLANYWSTPEEGTPEFGCGNPKSNENAQKAENWDSARNAMNTILANAEILWHYASVVDDDCPLALLPTE